MYLSAKLISKLSFTDKNIVKWEEDAIAFSFFMNPLKMSDNSDILDWSYFEVDTFKESGWGR